MSEKCYQCDVFISSTNLTDEEKLQVVHILKKMEDDYALCDKCAYKLFFMYYLSKNIRAVSKLEYYLRLSDSYKSLN